MKPDCRRVFFVGGNWKMNGSLEMASRLCREFGMAASSLPKDGVEIVIAPPFPYLSAVRRLLEDSSISVAAQNIHEKSSGAYTGEVSVEMLKDLAIGWTILGHSERRQHSHESNELVGLKTKTALDAGLSVIVCVGERLEDRSAGRAMDVIKEQLSAIFAPITADVDIMSKRLVVAYEPVWAIGTGKVASPQEAEEVHQEIRRWLAAKLGKDSAAVARIIYGGSVTAASCSELAKQADIDGFLVGGASLKPEFAEIMLAAKSDL